MFLVDTHSHIYLPDFKGEETAIKERAKKNNVHKIFLPNIDLTSIKPLMELCREDSSFYYPMMGLHPSSVENNYIEVLNQIKSHFHQFSFFAIGEIGIDLYWDKTYIEEQKAAFRAQLEWGKEMNLPVVIHARDSFNEIFEILDEVNDDKLFGIFHSFTGNIEQARYIIDKGFKLGINGIVTFKNTQLDDVVKQIDINHLVLETDSPYLAPVPKRGKRNESAYLLYIAENIAEIYQMPIEEVAAITTKNAFEIFGIKDE